MSLQDMRCKSSLFLFLIVFSFATLWTLPAYAQDVTMGEEITYEQIKNLDYQEQHLDLIRKEITLQAKGVIAQSKRRLERILAPENIDAAMKATMASTNKISEIVEKTVHKMRLKYSKEFKFFDIDKLNVLLAGLIFFCSIMWYTFRANRGDKLFIRRIPGLASIDEAVGRCTEMGKPVLYIPGIYDMDDIQTISSMSILGHVAQTAAEYETAIHVPCTRSLVMSTAHEVVKEAHIRAGKADHFNSDHVRYLTDDQFGYVAGVAGIMMRDQPSANFFIGVFFAESLILAETGHSVGAIQVAGTAMVHQIPFFITACDYTMIGEELFAAAAYLSGDSMQIGSIKGQDMGKIIIIAVILLGILVASMSSDPEQLQMVQNFLGSN